MFLMWNEVHPHKRREVGKATSWPKGKILGKERICRVRWNNKK